MHQVGWVIQQRVTIGIANTRFTELISGDLKAGDEVITRTVEPPVKK